MAYKILAIGSNSYTAVEYTVPSGKSAVISKVTVSSTSSFDGAIKVTNSASVQVQIMPVTLLANESVHLTGGITLAAGEKITITSNNPMVGVNAVVFGSEE